ncbi:MAG: hypothetical protein ACRBHB_01840 [Arenicella sp.]
MLLLAIFIIVAVIEYFLKKEKAYKWKEYLFISIVALIFGVVGFFNDQITVSISNDYFAIGKNLGGTSIRLNAAVLGFQAGSYAGILTSCIYLIVRKEIVIKQVLDWFVSISKFSMLFITLGSFSGFCLFYLGWQLTSLAEFDLNFMVVWGWHLGLYLGLIIGTIKFFLNAKSALDERIN